MPRPTDEDINRAEETMFRGLDRAINHTGTFEPDDQDVRRAAIVAHFAAALASLRSIPRGAK
jgi:hypothetical protein